MTITSKRLRVAFAGLAAAAALGSAAPAQADAPAKDCEARVDKLVAQFYDMADRRSYEAASEWWDARWHAVYTSCVSKEA